MRDGGQARMHVRSRVLCECVCGREIIALESVIHRLQHDFERRRVRLESPVDELYNRLSSRVSRPLWPPSSRTLAALPCH